ncbi:activator of 90 kDa heat shock protein ATPase homolog 1-like [Antedon mediterranea]|uniref:activator of 90 kDa heat shock protein ATPase homolog 1-like n=1 Tax=Antedon mediterranea TaxID=105859 RepID=UPI003AF90803
MAKWGEGDPRWIVEERPDATNVNNWHWTEKNASAWSKEKLLNLLMFLKIENEKGTCEICELSSIEGEATANNRKAKLIFFYEWVLKLEWKGKLKDCETELKGQIEIPNLSDENEPSDIDIIITTKKNTEESRTLKSIMLENGIELIRNQLAQYISALKAEFSVGMILPTDKKEVTPQKNFTTQPKTTMDPSIETSSPNGLQKQSPNPGVKIHTTKLTCTEKFLCAVEDIYKVLTDKNRVEAFTRSSVQMEATKGGKFSLFGGNVTGVFLELEMDKKIVQKWRFSNWPEAHYSIVTMNLSQGSDGAVVDLVQTGVPDKEVERTKQGWKENFWGRIRQTFGFGINLF